MGGRDVIVAMLILMTVIQKLLEEACSERGAFAKTLQFEIYARADSNANNDINDINERFVSKKKGDVPG